MYNLSFVSLVWYEILSEILVCLLLEGTSAWCVHQIQQQILGRYLHLHDLQCIVATVGLALFPMYHHDYFANISRVYADETMKYIWNMVSLIKIVVNFGYFSWNHQKASPFQPHFEIITCTAKKVVFRTNLFAHQRAKQCMVFLIYAGNFFCISIELVSEVMCTFEFKRNQS